LHASTGHVALLSAGIPLAIHVPSPAEGEKIILGDAAALASLSGPIEVRLASEIPNKAFFDVSVRPLSSVSATESKAIGQIIRSALEPSMLLTKAPRTLVQLVVQNLSSTKHLFWRDSFSAAMINASSLAILNAASVPMRGVVLACAVGKLKDGTLVIDPEESEDTEMTEGGCFAYLFADDVGGVSKAVCVWSAWRSRTGTYSQTGLVSAKEMGLQGSRLVYEKVRQYVSDPKLSKRSKETYIVVTGPPKEEQEASTDVDMDSEDDAEMVI